MGSIRVDPSGNPDEGRVAAVCYRPPQSHLVVTDLDGTLLDSAARLGRAHRHALEDLGRGGAVRVVATGRSLHSARTVMPADFPIDYLVFSSGAGVMSWADGQLLRSRAMAPRVVSRLVARLRALSLDFMVHHAVPDTHCFHYVRATRGNADFEHRIERYARFSQCLADGVPEEVEVSQLLVVEPPRAASHLDLLAREFEDVHVVRTTSPCDHASTWIELFPTGVSKSHAANWVRVRHGIDRTRTIAVGNDYNDLDMLEWAGRAYVVSNAPAPMRARFEVVRSNDEAGFTDAVRPLLSGG